MANSSEELNRFKTEINLTDFAFEHLNFELDQPRRSAIPSPLRLKGPGEKIVISRSPTSIWVYYSIHDFKNNGTIIKLESRELSMSLGQGGGISAIIGVILPGVT